MKSLKVIPIIFFMVIILLPTLGAGGTDNSKTPTIERGIFINHAMGSHIPSAGDDTADDYKIHQGISWSNTGMPYYDENNVLQYTTWPIEYVVYTADTGFFNTVEQAFETWDNQIAPNIFATPTQISDSRAPSPALDGQNTISWQNLGPKGPVAVTYYWYYPKTRQTKTMLEFDIVFNWALPWSTVRPVPVDSDGNPTYYDLASVATHEVGHTLVLFDLHSRNDYWLTMYGRTWMGDDLKDTLGYGDMLGIQELYP